MNINYDEIKKTQLVALEVLEVFKDICRAHDLKYYAIGGTCIGAIRHKGFIPWDDDIDVAMPNDDYYKFLSICETELKEPYSIVDPRHIKHYSALYHKLQDASTTFVEQFYEQFPDRYSGIYIDIFPICGLPEDDKERKKIIQKNELLKKINRKLRYPFNYDKGLKSKVKWLLLEPTRVLLPFYWATDKQHRLIKKLPLNQSQFVLFPWRRLPDPSRTYKNIFYYDDFRDSIEVPFEKTSICVPIGYDRYLSMDFGDYMKLPPEEKRVPGHPKAIIDFERPFTYYKTEKERMK